MGRQRTAKERAADAQAVIDQANRDAGELTPKTHTDIVARNLEIFRAHLRAIDTYDLAATYGLTPDTIRGIIRQQRSENQRLSRMNPVEVVEELTSQIDGGISELAGIAAQSKGSVRVSAVTARINAIFQKGKWLQSAGILPQQAEELRIQIDASNMAQGIMTVLENNGLLTPELIDEITQHLPGTDVVDGEAVEIPVLEPGAET